MPIVLNATFSQQTEFVAYFLLGHADDLELSCDKGVIEPSMKEQTRLPIDVIYSAKQYGKLTKGTLVIETSEAEYIISINGKIPDYIPPVAKGSFLDSFLLDSSPKKPSTPSKRRNIIKENIENAKITKPKSPRRKTRVTFGE